MGVPKKIYNNNFPNLKIDALKWCIQLIILEISNLKIVLFECTNKFCMSKANNHHSTSFESKIPFQLNS